ncbi:MAG: hypothetical protein JF595_10510 [Sphingomonadales bacterium]|nr:hypothetical protein [Sphingomonadales bacterium]
MDETLETPSTASEKPAKERFAKAIEEAKAGAQALGKEAQERADLYRDKLSSTGGEWTTQAREKAASYANEGKTKASEAISGLGKLVADNAVLIDDKVGPKYGDYARSAAQSMQDAAARLDAKELDELAEDAKEFVRKSPGLAVGMAAVAGFMLARMLRGSND